MATPFTELKSMITSYMELDSNRVWNYASNVKAPTDENIFVTMAIESQKKLGKKSEFDGDSLTDSQYISIAARINIEICSRGYDAEDRKEELLMMLDSIIGQQIMEDNNIRIDTAGDMLDLSAVEGPGILRRFRLPVIVYYVKSKGETTDQYFDKHEETGVTNGSLIIE